MNGKALSLSSDVYWVGANDSNIPLFEGLWEIPEGVSYNSYLIKGSERTALIDSVSASKAEEHFEKINQLTDLSKLDYLVINHMEPDHTSAIPELLKRAPNVKVFYSPIAKSIFQKFYQVEPSATLVKGDDVTLSLGNRTLRFVQTPWLHWPETMSSYLIEERIMFCCDAFGAFRTLPTGAVLESDIDMDKQNVCGCSQKYFASVFNGQREWVLKAIDKFEKMEISIDVLAPSHGPVLNKTAGQTIDRWKNWSRGTFEKKVVVAYASMYGMTAKCLDAIAEGVAQAGGSVVRFDVSKELFVDVLTALVDAPALLIGVPTYEHEIFPKVADLISLLGVKKFSGRSAGVFGSFGWSGEATRKASAELTSLGFDMVNEPLPIYGSPTDQDLIKVRDLAKGVAEKAFSSLE